MKRIALVSDTWATQIHGITGQEIRDCLLTSGTRAQLDADIPESEYHSIIADDDGCRYRIRKHEDTGFPLFVRVID